jgi:hypothetical protein
VPVSEAVVSWYDDTYQPIVRIARERGVLQRFPDRSETDIYLWVMAHRDILIEREDQEVAPVDAVQDLADEIADAESGFSFGAIRRRLARWIGGPHNGRTP